MIDLDKPITKNDFIKILSRLFLSFTIFSLIPIKTFAQKKISSIKMKVKSFKRSDLFKENDLAG